VLAEFRSDALKMAGVDGESAFVLLARTGKDTEGESFR
jgi:hypothetical protein